MSGFEAIPGTGKQSGIKSHSYYFNGLTFQSEIFLPEVSPCFDTAGQTSGNVVFVRYGVVPHELSGAYYKTPILIISPNEVLIHIDNTASYYIKDGNEVIVEPLPGASDKAVRLYILTIVLGTLLHQNDIFSLHASAIKFENEAILVAGHSGAGKSTLALGLYRKGYEVLNDDISSICFNSNGTPHIYPGVTYLKLWTRSLERYGYEAAGFDKIRDELEKYSFPLTRGENTGILSVKAIFLLNESGEPTGSTKIEGLEKFQKIKANTYRYKLVQHLQKISPHFISATKFAAKVPLFKVNRNSSMLPQDFAEYMEEQFRQL